MGIFFLHLFKIIVKLALYKNVSNLIDVDQESILECYGKELNITEYFQFSDSSDQVLEGISTRFFRFSKCDEEAFRAGFDYSGKKFIDEMVQKLSSPNREMIVVRSLSLYHIIHERFEFAADVNLFNGNNKYRVLLQRNTEPDNNEADYRNGEVIDMSDHFKNKQEINLPGYK